MARLVDEIKEYLDVRYLSPIKVVDSLLSFHIHFKKLDMKHVVVYLLSQHNIVFNTRIFFIVGSKLCSKEGDNTYYMVCL